MLLEGAAFGLLFEVLVTCGPGFWLFAGTVRGAVVLVPVPAHLAGCRGRAVWHAGAGAVLGRCGGIFPRLRAGRGHAVRGDVVLF